MDCPIWEGHAWRGKWGVEKMVVEGWVQCLSQIHNRTLFGVISCPHKWTTQVSFHHLCQCRIKLTCMSELADYCYPPNRSDIMLFGNSSKNPYLCATYVTWMLIEKIIRNSVIPYLSEDRSNKQRMTWE